MNLPDFAYRNVVDLYNLHRDLADGTDDQRRQLTKMIVEQTTFDEPTGTWGHKAEKGGSVSKDVMGKQQIIAWDLFNGSTRAPNPSPIPSFTLNSATQELRFYQGVDYLNHSGGGTPPPDNSELEKRVSDLEQEVSQLNSRLNDLDMNAVKNGSMVSLQTNDKSTYLTAEAGGGKKASQQPVATDRTSAGGWEKWKVTKE